MICYGLRPWGVWRSSWRDIPRNEGGKQWKKAESGEAEKDYLAASHRAYVAASLPPDRFWEISPRLTLAEIEAAGDRLNREADQRAWSVWHAAYLPRSEKPIPLASLLTGAKDAEPEELLAMRLSASNRGLQTVKMADHLKGMN